MVTCSVVTQAFAEIVWMWRDNDVRTCGEGTKHLRIRKQR